ncbi:MAG: ArsR family transcriptional regulator [Micropruina sp.]|uniref:MarR family transcriptional regulator n=1 Tax=Micropruina sp. TaxID=2737536 RepID=UPI0039E32104
MRTEAPLLAPIFRSDGQARLLSALLLGDDELSVTDLATRTGSAYPSVHREVARLLDAGILAERQVGRTRLIRANAGNPIVPPLRDILLIVSGPAALLAEELRGIGGVESAFLYGSFAARVQGVEGPAPNDIDLMVIGTPDPDLVDEACDRVEDLVQRPVNATILTAAEAQQESGFLTQVRNSPIAPIVGSPPWQ